MPRAGASELRRAAVMQRERIALVLDHDAGAGVRGVGKLRRNASRKGAARADDLAVGTPHLGAVAADRRQLERREQRSSSASGRPLTNASAPPVSSSSRSSERRSSSGT